MTYSDFNLSTLKKQFHISQAGKILAVLLHFIV